MNYEIKNNIPILLDWKDKTDHYLSEEPNYKCCTYNLNDYGYRASHNYEDILEDENKIICIGCSFTFGIGLDENQTWPYKLSKLMNTSFMNLGYPGGSIKYVLWQLYNTINKIPNKDVFVLIPPLGRDFTLNDNSFFCINNNLGVVHSYFDEYLIKNFCEKNNINYLSCDIFGERGNELIELGFAKDGLHYGEGYQTAISKEFYKKNVKLI